MDVNGVCTININNNACCFGSCCECLVVSPPLRDPDGLVHFQQLCGS